MYKKILWKKVVTLAAILCTLIICCNTMAASVEDTSKKNVNAREDSDNQRSKSVFLEDRHSMNVEFQATYSNGLKQTSSDWITITFQRELNAEENPDQVDICHVDMLAAYGLRGYIDPGWYDVIGITYHGENPSLEGRLIGVPSLIRVYNDQIVQIPVAIGDQAVKLLQNQLGDDKVYIEADGRSKYTSKDSRNIIEAENENPESIFVDLSVFGNDNDARRRYLEHIKDLGMVNENYQYTDTAERMLEDQKNQPDNVGSIMLSEDSTADDTEDMENFTDAGRGSEYAGGDSLQSNIDSMDSGPSSKQVIKEKRYDAEDLQIESPKGTKDGFHRMLSIIVKYLPILMLFFVIGIVFFIYQKK